MKKTLLAVGALIGFAGIVRALGSSDSLVWVEKAEAPYIAPGCGATTDGHYVYLFGGGIVSNNFFYRYDPSTDSWDRLPDLPKYLTYPSGTYLSGKIYIGESASDRLYVYDLSSNNWSLGPELPRSPIRGFFCVAAADSLYVMIDDHFYCYNISTSTWESRPSNSVLAIIGNAVMSAYTRIYWLYGYSNYSGYSRYYDASTGEWNALPSPSLGIGRGLGLINGKIYACGGWTSDSISSYVEVYDPANPELGWLPATPMLKPQALMAYIHLHNRIHIIGGKDGFGNPTSTHQVAVLLIYDAGVEGIGLPEQVGTGHRVIPVIEVKNCSTNTIPDFDVHSVILFENDTVYDTFNIIQNLEGNTTVSETLAPWIPEKLGVYQVITWTRLDGDVNPSNDTLKTTIEVVGIGEELFLPKSTCLRVLPNPAKGVIDIRYGIREEGVVRLEVYDGKGRLVERLLEEEKGPGYYSLRWEKGNIPDGVYFLRFRTHNFARTIKVILMR